MPASQEQPRKFRFGVYELDEAARELRKHGLSIHLQYQPWEVLRTLVERPGEVVSREDLRRRLWPDGTYVDYEQSLNKAVNKLREALSDSADRPRYIETLARRGYRFIAPVEQELPKPQEPIAQAAEPAPQTAPQRRRAFPWLAAGGCVLAVVLVTGLWPIDVPQVEKVVPLTNDTTLKDDTIYSDGHSVLFTADVGVWSVPVTGGAPKRLQLPFVRPDDWIGIAGYAPVRRQMLISTSDGLWLAGEGEAPHVIYKQKEGEYWVALAPDAERLAVAAPDGIYIQSVASGERKRVHPAPGGWTPVWWHPSGHRLGFFGLPLDARAPSEGWQAWQVNDDGTHLRPIAPEQHPNDWWGAWSQDGRRYFGIEKKEVIVRVEAGILGWLRKAAVARLYASGQQLEGHSPAIDPVDPRRLYAVGTTRRGETMRYDRKAQRWVPFLEGFSGQMIERSPDGRSLVYIPFPGYELHKCAIDGSGDIVLTPGVRAVNPKWSPDGKRVAFAGTPGNPEANPNAKWKLWLVSSSGGDAAPYRPETDPITGAYWSRDGKRLLLALVPAGGPPEELIRILDLETGKLEAVPGSEKFWSPRWSPDEKRIVALAADGPWLPSIFDAEKRIWRPLGKQPIGYNEWSRDGKYVHGMWWATDKRKIVAFRIEAATGRTEEVVRSYFNTIDNFGFWVGWTWDDDPLTIRDLSSSQIYRIDLDR